MTSRSGFDRQLAFRLVLEARRRRLLTHAEYKNAMATVFQLGRWPDELMAIAERQEVTMPPPPAQTETQMEGSNI